MSAFNGRHGDKLYVLGYPEFVGLDVVQADGARASVNLETDIAEVAALEILKVAGAKWMGVEGGPSTIQVISDDTTDDELMATLLDRFTAATRDRKSTRLNSSHVKISYAVFCLKKK